MQLPRARGWQKQSKLLALIVVLFSLLLLWNLSRPSTPSPSSSFYSRNGHNIVSPSNVLHALLLPAPQLYFPILDDGKPLIYQMHNCVRGRDGSKFGLKDAGVAWHPTQKARGEYHTVFDDAQIIVACNNEKPSRVISHDPKVNGKKLVSTTIGIVDEYCLGSGKKDQLLCRRGLAKLFGCKYEDLGIQPKQYMLSLREDCETIVTRAQNEPTRAWLLKPSASLRGRGIRFFKTSQALLEQVSNCESTFNREEDAIIQEYVMRPALLDGKQFKFDVRTWMLIASVDPLVLFYREGFVRVASTKYEEASEDPFAHITNLEGQERRSSSGTGRHSTYLRSFEETSEELAREYGFPADFMQRAFRKQIIRAQNYAALAQFLPEVQTDKRKGFYHLFACDSVVDQDQRVHLLECNGFPGESQQIMLEKRIKRAGVDDPQLVWKEMMSLVLNLHLEPWLLLPNSTASRAIGPSYYANKKQGLWAKPPNIQGDSFSAHSGYTYGSWSLVFNELETPFSTVNACESDFQQREE